MNKIFMTKKNTHGQTVVCSEKTRTRGKMSALVLAIAAASAGVVGTAHAELVNNSTYIQATQETGETVVGYDAMTGDQKTTAVGFGTSAIAQGSIAIGAEAGASGKGLTREESEGLVKARVDIKNIDTQLSNLREPTLFDTPVGNEGYLSGYDFNYKTSQELLDYYNSRADIYDKFKASSEVIENLNGLRAYSNLVSAASEVGYNENFKSDAVGRVYQEFSKEQSDIVKNLTQISDNLSALKEHDKNGSIAEYQTSVSDLINKLKAVNSEDSFKTLTLDDMKNAVSILSVGGFGNDVTQLISNLEARDLFIINRGLVEAGKELSDPFFAQMQDIKSAGYNEQITRDSKNELIENLQSVSDAEKQRLQTIAQNFAPEFIQNMPKVEATGSSKYMLQSDVFNIKDYERLDDGQSNALKEQSTQIILGILKTQEALRDKGIEVTQADIMRAYVYQGGRGSVMQGFVTNLSTWADEYLDKKETHNKTIEELNAQKNDLINGFVETAKKLGYENPTIDDLNTILGSLSPNAISIGRRSYVSGENSIGVGANGLITADNVVSVGANNFVNSANVTALGANINVDDQAPVGSVVIGEGSQVAIVEPSENITIASVKYDFAGTAPQSAVSVGSVGKERQIKNVAAGVVSAASTDAINGSQLYALAEAVAAIGVPNETNITGTPDITVNSTTKDGVTTHIIGLSDPIKAQIAKEESVSAGANIVVKQDKLNVTGGKNFEVSLSSDLTGINSITNAGKPISFGNSRLTDVADPINDGDAVNKGYLDKSIQDVKDSIVVTTVSAADDGVTVNKNGNDYAVGLSDKTKATLADVEKLKPQVASNKAEIEKLKPQVAQNTADIENLKPRVAKNEADIAKNTADIETNRANIAKGLNFKTQDDVTTNKQLGDTVTVLGDSNIKTSTAGGNIIVGLNQDIKVNSIRLGDTITANTQGINMGGQGITGLKPGVVAAGSTDAINGDQLFNMGNDIKNYIGGIEDGLEAGLAGSRAVAALPQTHTSGKSMLAVAMGSYRDKGAVAVGFSRLSDNGRTTLKLNLDATTEKTFGAGVGIGYEF